MAVSTFGSGTQSATVTTEHFLSSPNVVGVFTLYVDLVNMAANDVVELRAYKMTIAAGTQRVAFFAQFAGVQPTDALIAMSVQIPNDLTDANAVRFSLKQTFGTSRNFPWAVVNSEDFTAVASVNVTQISGDSTAADNAEAFFDGTGYAGTNNVIPTVTTTATATAVTTVNGLAAGVITAASIAADAITDAKVASDVTIASVTGSVGSVTGLTAATVHSDLDDIQARLPAALTAGGNIKADALALSGDTVAADNAEAFFDGTGYAGTGNVIPTVTTLTGHTAQTGDSFARLGAPAGASIAADLVVIDDFLDTEVAAILAAVDTEVAAIKAKTDNLPEGIQKNTALANFEFFMVLASDHISAATGLTITAERSIDGGAFAAMTNTAVEVSAGIYKINLAAADTNGDFITYKFTSATADATLISFKTEA